MNLPKFRLALVASLLAGALIAAGSWASMALAGDSPAAIKLEPLNWEQYLKRLAANKQAKYTLVDAWATTCGPCKENFPHLVEMYHKYADKGLAVMSLSLDDPSDAKAIVAAEAFLKEKKAPFTNVLLDETFGDGFDKLDINAIPAVFIYGPDAKLIGRFTMDDPNDQFTYEEVEKAVVDLLAGKPLPKSRQAAP
jgi:thiol-disulfide isomerase/thioredoxin